MFEMEYRERINRVIKAIIRNLDGDWTTEPLAGFAGISAFYFHRIFRALTGETMFAFLPRRKMLRALQIIDEGRFTLTEIALECGFDSGSSLPTHLPQIFQPHRELQTEIWIPSE